MTNSWKNISKQTIRQYSSYIVQIGFSVTLPVNFTCCSEAGRHKNGFVLHVKYASRQLEL